MCGAPPLPATLPYTLLLLCLFALLSLTTSAANPPAPAQTLPPNYTTRVGYDQHPGRALPLNATFTDDTGHPIRLGSLMGARPTILVLAYYGCPNLCTIVLNGTLDSLRDLKPTVGTDFDVIVASFDPAETAALAAAKKAASARRYGRPGSAHGWHFLTGTADSIRQLTTAVGYRYFYDETTHQFAHPSGIVVITPTGKISQYLMGVDFPPQDLAAALNHAAGEQIAPLSRALLLLCFCYDPATGKYSLAIARLFQVAGLLTITGLLGLLYSMSRTPRPTSSST